MTAYVAKRVLGMVPTLLFISVLVFVVIQLPLATSSPRRSIG